MERIYDIADRLLMEEDSILKDKNSQQAGQAWKKAKQEPHGALLNKQNNVFASGTYVPRTLPCDVYDILSVKLFHIFILVSRDFRKNAQLCDCLHRTLKWNPRNPSQQHQVRSCKKAIMNRWNSLLAAFENNIVVCHLQVDFSAYPESGLSEWIFLQKRAKGILKTKDHSVMDMTFPFLAAYIDKATVYRASLRLTEVHTIYSELVISLLFKRDRFGTSERETS